jgi:cytosine/adenosine deaminase-related metal-dependent hydrolase
MTPFSLRARWVVPVDRPPIAGGYVTITGDRITTVSDARPDGAIDDLGDVALLPGLVNDHTHLEFSDLNVPLGRPGMSLPAWIRLVIGERKRARRDVEAALAAGLSESLAAGVTALGDVCTSAFRGEDFKVRPTTVAFQESIGFSAQRVDSAFADLEQRWQRTASPAGLSPHAPYTVHPQLLARIVQAASEHGVPIAMHLAESREELELLADGTGEFRELLDERSMWDETAIPRGSRPLDYLRALAVAPRALVIHGNYLDDDEIAFVAERRPSMSVVYCPRTHAYFQHERYPLESLHAAGVRVVLGTDSRASNPDLSLLAELRFAARRHPGVVPAKWLEMATIDAAAALGRERECGSLAPGKRADMIALACPAVDPMEAIVAGNDRVGAVWLAGRRQNRIATA